MIISIDAEKAFLTKFSIFDKKKQNTSQQSGHKGNIPQHTCSPQGHKEMDTTQQLDNSKNNKEDLISSHIINQPRAGDIQRKAYGQILL